jgi:hypothetical protein
MGSLINCEDFVSMQGSHLTASVMTVITYTVIKRVDITRLNW